MHRPTIPNPTQRKVLERDGHQCRRCGRPWNLEMHHRKPWSLGGPDIPANLMTLCFFCHREWTKKWMATTDEPDFGRFMRRVPDWFVQVYPSLLDAMREKTPDLKDIIRLLYPVPDWMWILIAELSGKEPHPRARLYRRFFMPKAA